MKPQVNIEDLEFELIDYGAEEVFEEGEHIIIYGTFSEFGAIQKALEEKEYEVIQAGFERIPMDTKKLSPEAEEEIEKLLEKFEEDDDVQHVYHNMG